MTIISPNPSNCCGWTSCSEALLCWRRTRLTLSGFQSTSCFNGVDHWYRHWDELNNSFLSGCGDSQHDPLSMATFAVPIPTLDSFGCFDDPPDFGTLILEQVGPDAAFRWYLVYLFAEVSCTEVGCAEGEFKLFSNGLEYYLNCYVSENFITFCRTPESTARDILSDFFVPGDGGPAPTHTPSACATRLCDGAGSPVTNWPGNHPPGGLLCGTSEPPSGYEVVGGSLSLELLNADACDDG